MGFNSGFKGLICLYGATSFFCSPVFCPKLGLYLILLPSFYLFYDLSNCNLIIFSCISISAAAVIHLTSLALMVQFSLLYNKAGRASVMYSFILVFFKSKYTTDLY